MPDLLPHLARKEQYTKKIGEAVSAGKMNLIFNSIPYLKDKDVKEAVKLNALVLLNEKYNIVEENFLSAELELVPAGKDHRADKAVAEQLKAALDEHRQVRRRHGHPQTP